MPPKNKAKAAGISASSFFDLKAELSKQEDDFAKSKAAGKSTLIVGGVKRPDKKPTVWARPNKGVNARAARDIELEAVSKPTLESARAALERKAKIYDKLKKGKTGGLNDAQYDALLVDFDSMEPGQRFESDSEDEDESLTVPKPGEEDPDDPVIEYEDEYGRVRTARRSEIPRHLAPDNQAERDEEEADVIYNPVNHFPTYQPSNERIEAIAQAHSESSNPLGVHYDGSAEVRAKGAGFYQFSADEETRRMQMEELKGAREETERKRREGGAIDLRPGEAEGMKDDEVVTLTGKSKAMEKRKRELDERRRMVDAKRRKVKGGAEAEAPGPIIAPSTAEGGIIPTFEARDEGKSVTFQAPLPTFTAAASLDPFATLEAQVERKDKGKSKASLPTAADHFLAELEWEMSNGTRGKGR